MTFSRKVEKKSKLFGVKSNRLEMQLMSSTVRKNFFYATSLMPKPSNSRLKSKHSH